MRQNATVRACSWDDYASDAANAKVGFIVFVGSCSSPFSLPPSHSSAVGFVVSCIFGLIITLCCLKCIFTKDKKGYDGSADDSDEYSGRARNKFRLLLAIPCAIIMCAVLPPPLLPFHCLPLYPDGVSVGAIIIIIGNFGLSEDFNEISTILRDRRDASIRLRDDLISSSSLPLTHSPFLMK